MDETGRKPFRPVAPLARPRDLTRGLLPGGPAGRRVGSGGLFAALVIAVALLVAAMVAGLAIHDAGHRQGLSIADFEIAEGATQRGYTSVVVSRRIADMIDTIYRAGDTRRMRAITGDVAFDRRLPEVTIPLGGLTLEATGELARSLLGMPRNKLFGEVTSEIIQEIPPHRPGDDVPEALEKTLFRVTLRTSDGRLVPRATRPSERLDDALREAVLMLVERFDPYVAATYHLARGDLDGARRLITICLSNDDPEDDPWAKILIARIQLDVDIDLAGALRTYREIIRDHPGFVLARTELSETLRVIGRHAEAATEAGRALSVDSRNVAAYLSLGLAESDRGHHQAAIDALREAERLDPRNADAASGLARALVALGRPAEGLQVAEAALTRLPGSAALVTMRGLALRRLSRTAEARSAVDLAVALDPRGEARAQLALLLAEQDDWDAALASARMVAERGPAAVPFWMELAEIAAAKARHREAADAAREATERDSTHIPAKLLLARVLTAAGRTRDSIAPLADASRRAPADAAVRLALFHALRATHDWTGARAAYRALAQVSPESAEAARLDAAAVFMAVARADARAGRRAQARESLSQALALDGTLRASLDGSLARLLAGPLRASAAAPE
jgi:tetratricopeptide (TPR) repeat protein